VQLDWAASPMVALGYLLLAAICVGVAMREGSLDANVAKTTTSAQQA
jgi:hypothetical protein